MNKTLLHLGAWARLLSPSVQGDIPTATAPRSHRQVFDWVPALIAALVICGVLGGISLLFPPFIQWDSAYAFLAWRGTLLGAANYVITPDPANIAQDTSKFLAHWSPGQYLVPGIISLIGVPLGIAMTLTAAFSMLAALIGWVVVVREFVPGTSLPLLVTVLIGSFRYSTTSFDLYHGGEILLEAATPWLFLTAHRVPKMNAVPAALAAAGAVFFAFLAKLTGLIVVAAALVAASLVVLSFGRRITQGMIGGAVGALATFAILYVTFFSRGATLVSTTAWSLSFTNIAFSFLVPWVAGMSWGDLLDSLIFSSSDRFTRVPIAFLLLVIPPALLVGRLVLFWELQTTSEKKFRLFSLWFFGVVATVFSLIYIHGNDVWVEERHFRSAGTLLFVCALVSALAVGTPRWTRGSFLALCVVMALYGLASFSHRAWIAANGRWLDSTSWTNQPVDAGAIDFAEEGYAHEGREALFVLPMPQLVVTLPTDARILVVDLAGAPESEFAGLRYAGRAQGHIFVLMQNSISDTSKGRALLSAFRDYDPHTWERKSFADMSVFYQ